MKLVPLKVILTINALGAATHNFGRVVGVLKGFASSSADSAVVDILITAVAGNISTTLINVAGYLGTAVVGIKQQDKGISLVNIASNYSNVPVVGELTVTLANGTQDDEITIFLLIECGDNAVVVSA